MEVVTRIRKTVIRVSVSMDAINKDKGVCEYGHGLIERATVLKEDVKGIGCW
jgi:hypothetical protein